MNLADLSQAVNVHPDDVRVVLGWMDASDGDDRATRKVVLAGQRLFD